jgi:hypothetical protein
MMHMAGMNSYGLLKNEQGVHRKVLRRQPGDGDHGRRRSTMSCDCRVMVLPDVQSDERSALPVRVSAQRVTPQRKGWRIRLLSRRVKVSHATTGQSVEMYTDKKTEADRRILVDFFQSYLKYGQGPAGGSDTPDAGVWGSVVRTMETGTKSCVRDHKSGIVIKRTQDYLAGKIDSLLLERLV